MTIARQQLDFARDAIDTAIKHIRKSEQRTPKWFDKSTSDVQVAIQTLERAWMQVGDRLQKLDEHYDRW